MAKLNLKQRIGIDLGGVSRLRRGLSGLRPMTFISLMRRLI